MSTLAKAWIGEPGHPAFTERYPTRIAPLEAMRLTGVLLSLSVLTEPDLALRADAFLASVTAPGTEEVVARARESLRLHSAAARRIPRQLESALPAPRRSVSV